ncbi:DUF6311 domain-containing protein [Archangium lansingense]|uniref:DUF6311 domain-containing protein n=1 Tax=Archangium lansingense TaxID=2995310 RepID=A0ABT4A260_9BACT|nr:DUF6311 domain-containing protein [Archangium lansinium]MCY1075737.1 DUF6311 domain-containing protein [Archangium lansinium]
MSSPEALPASRWERLLPWLGAILGVVWFLAAFGPGLLDPTNLRPVSRGDLAQHVLGWFHFRNVPWSFPLGSTPTLIHPMTVAVGFMDSNPWVALAFKPFSRWLPQDFHYVGLWFALCFALQGWMGVKLMERLSPRLMPRLLGAALFVTSPVLLFRVGHDTLCAHWMLLAMGLLHLRPHADSRAAWRTVGWALALNVLAAGVHPYLEMMVLALTASLLVTLAWVEHLLSWRAAAAAFGGVVGVAVGAFVLFGYVGQGVGSEAIGFGFYSADLLALINPNGWSSVLPGWSVGEGQYEGFGYLGTGSLALSAVALLEWPARWWPQAKAAVKAQLPLVVVVLLLSLLAFSSVVTAAGHHVLTMRSAVEPLLPLLAPFRSSGRFIWLLNYAVVTGVLALTVWRWRQHPRVLVALLLGAVAIQGVDTPNMWRGNLLPSHPWPRLQAPEWERVDPFYRHIVLFPPILPGAGEPCEEGIFPDDAYLLFGDLAYRRGVTTNSAALARIDASQAMAACRSLRSDVQSGRFAEDTLYVVGKKQTAAFQRPELTCGVLDGYTVCVAARQGQFREALVRAPSVATPLPKE